MDRTQVRLVVAAIGAGAAIGMAVLGVAESAVSSAQPDPAAPGPVPTKEANVGQTVTQTKPPSAPSVAVAKPALKGPAKLPPEEQGLPG